MSIRMLWTFVTKRNWFDARIVSFSKGQEVGRSGMFCTVESSSAVSTLRIIISRRRLTVIASGQRGKIMDDTFEFTFDEESEKKLFEIMADVNTEKTPSFTITDKYGHTAEYVKVIRCKNCKYYVIQYCEGFGDGYYDPELGYCHNEELAMRSDEY